VNECRAARFGNLNRTPRVTIHELFAMSEPVLTTGSSGSSPLLPGEGVKVRPGKGPETVINPERRPGPALATLVAGPGETATSSAAALPKSSIVRLLFPQDEEAAVQTFDPQIQLHLGHFAIIDRIRTGGMGAVFRALDTRLNRVVALKVLPPSLSRDPLIVQRFKNEGQSAAQLDHENVARVYFIGEEHGLHYIAFEFINGTNVRDLILEQGRLPVGDALNYVLQIASALVHTSAQGVIHRDIKPSNIIITPTGRAKLVDLGLARQETKEDQAVELTIAGTTLGTFDYISPEQARDPRGADIRSDIYSLGCTLYHMLTGEPPYPEGTVLQKLLQHQGDEAPDPAAKNRQVPDNLSVVVRKMMAKDPRRRYQSAELLVRDLMLVAGSLGLRSISPEGLVWLASQPDRTSFWERHLAWMVTAALLLAIAGYLEFGPSVFVSTSDDGVSTHAGRLSNEDPSPHQKPRSNAKSDRLTSGQPRAPDKRLSRSNDGEIVDNRRSRSDDGNSQFSDDGESATARRGADGRDESDRAESSEQVTAIKPFPLVAGKSHEGDTSQSRFPVAVQRPSTLDETSDPGEFGSATNSRPPDSPATSVSTETVRSNDSGASSSIPSERINTDRTKDDPPPAVPSEDEGIFVVGRDAASNRRFASLELACASVRENGAIIELRFNGRRRESVLRINRKLTIRAARGFRPVIEFRPAQATIEEYQARAVWAPSGSLDLVGVDLVLFVDETAPVENWSLFSLERPDVVRMERVTVTIVNPTRRPAAVFELRTPDGALMPDMPVVGAQPRSPLKVELTDSLVRGDGDLFIVRHAEAARLAVDKSIVALNGSLLVARGNSEAIHDNAQLELRLDHVTSVLAAGLVRFDIGSMPRKLLPLQVSASNCIFSNSAAVPLVEMTGNAPPQDFRELLSWGGQNNFYDRYSTLWLIASMEESGARSEPWDAAAWRRWTEASETNPHFGSVVWSKRGWMTRPFVELVPADFALDRTAGSNSAVGVDDNFKDAGADLESLRTPASGD
jgi:serine/threonine-protein kinase